MIFLLMVNCLEWYKDKIDGPKDVIVPGVIK